MVPQHHASCAVVALRDVAFKSRHIPSGGLRPSWRAISGRIEGRAFRYGPAGECATNLEPKIVVEARSVMALNTKKPPVASVLRPLPGAGSGVALNLRLRMYSSRPCLRLYFPFMDARRRLSFDRIVSEPGFGAVKAPVPGNVRQPVENTLCSPVCSPEKRLGGKALSIAAIC